MKRGSLISRVPVLAVVAAGLLGLGITTPLGHSNPPCWAKHGICATSSPTSTAATTTAATTTTTTTTPYFVGDFNTCDLSQWQDFHDAWLNATPPGFVVEPAGSGVNDCYAQTNVTNQASTSASGDASYLWEGDGSNSYQLPYMQEGQDAWFRMQVLLPDGTDPAYPGKFAPQTASSGWDMLEEWHQLNMYSTFVGICGWCNPMTLLLRPSGGNGAAPTQEWIEQVPLQFNHWYDIIVHQVFYPDSRGLIEWYVDGALIYSANVPTMSVAPDGSVPGVSHQVGLYRGPSEPYTDTVYIDGVVDGVTAASVGFTP